MNYMDMVTHLVQQKLEALIFEQLAIMSDVWNANRVHHVRFYTNLFFSKDGCGYQTMGLTMYPLVDKISLSAHEHLGI